MQHRLNISVQTGRPYIHDASEMLQSYRQDSAAKPLYGDHRDDIPRTARVPFATNADLRRRQKTDHETTDDLTNTAHLVERQFEEQVQQGGSVFVPRTNNLHDDILAHAMSMQEMRSERPETMPVSEWFYMQSKKY